jgi:protein SCO1/2
VASLSAIARRLAPLLLVALVAAGCGASSAAPPELRGSLMDPPLPARDFALRDQSGKLVRLSALAGKYRIVTFLYTSCPDVCPLIAANLNEALRRLAPAERAQVRVLAVSVDPKGDTATAVDRFVATHRLLPQFRYLTGTRKQLAPVWRAYGIAVQPAGSSVVVPHTSWELLVTPEGHGKVLYDAQVKAGQVVHDLRLLMDAS